MRRTGQATVEFALAMGVFLLLVLGTVDLARGYFGYILMTNAARDASRYGATHVGAHCWETAAAPLGSNLKVVAGPQSFKDSLDVCSTAPPLCSYPSAPPVGNYITVCGTYSFTPLVGELMGKTISIPIETSAPVG